MFEWEPEARLRILDFDVEARPLSYWTEKRPTAEITAIAWCFADDLSSMEVKLLGVDEPQDMLTEFVKVYDEADIVTAHNIRRYDLPQINGALMEYGLPGLSSKFTQDTYLDLKRKGDIPASQEFLIDLFGLGQKVHMGQHAWREANRLLPQGIEKTRQRVAGDVYDHLRLRVELIKRNLLKPGKYWRA